MPAPEVRARSWSLSWNRSAALVIEGEPRAMPLRAAERGGVPHDKESRHEQ
jgi:hypothetical protein